MRGVGYQPRRERAHERARQEGAGGECDWLWRVGRVQNSGNPQQEADVTRQAHARLPRPTSTVPSAFAHFHCISLDYVVHPARATCPALTLSLSFSRSLVVVAPLVVARHIASDLRLSTSQQTKGPPRDRLHRPTPPLPTRHTAMRIAGSS